MEIQSPKRSILRFAALLACVLISAALMPRPTAGQSGLGSGRVEGTGTDESGATVAAAMITAHSDATGLTAAQSSDSTGHFIFPYLSPRAYHRSVDRAGC